jgi:hypothetical protein
MLEKQREFENEKQGLKDVRFFNYFKDCVSVGIKLWNQEVWNCDGSQLENRTRI